MATKTLLSAVELKLFTKLSGQALTGAELAAQLSLHPRAIPEFPDTLLALGLLDREGDGPDAKYSNTPETAAFLDKASPHYLGGVLDMSNTRLYQFWGNLTEGLRSGQAQERSQAHRKVDVRGVVQRPKQTRTVHAGHERRLQGGLRRARREVRLQALPNPPCDVGGATGQLALIIAGAHPHMRCTSFDLPIVETLAKATIEAAGATDRVTTASGDFLNEPLPKADIITMSLILHDWNHDRKLHLIQSAYDALPAGGALIIIEPLIDDARRTNAFGLLMSLNMLIEFGDAFGFTGRGIWQQWCHQVGFKHTEMLPLAGAATAAIART